MGCQASGVEAPPSFSQNPPAPDFIGTQADWLNSKPLHLKDLRGKVVLVDFWEYTCVNCIRTFPYVKEWWKRYKDDGLVIVGIHTPEFKFAHSAANVQDAVKRFGLEFPILIDSDYSNWNAYSNEYWPADYLIDAQGRIVETHFGEGDYGATEKKIQQLLLANHPGLKLPPLMAPVRDTDKPGAVCRPVTEEMYAGERGAQNGQFGGGSFVAGREAAFQLPSRLAEGVFYLGGRWTPEEEHLDAAGDGSSLEISYRAKDCNAVLRRTGEPLRVEVLQDGKPVAKKDAGSDIRYDGATSYFTLDEPRMYNLTHNAIWGAHRLELRPLSAGFQIYSFAFSTDCMPGG